MMTIWSNLALFTVIALTVIGVNSGVLFGSLMLLPVLAIAAILIGQGILPSSKREGARKLRLKSKPSNLRWLRLILFLNWKRRPSGRSLNIQSLSLKLT